MNKLAFGAALAALSLAMPGAALAQKNAAAPILVVDTDTVLRDCTACRAAQTQLQGQFNTLQQRQTTLQQQLQTEGAPIDTAVKALNGRQPDAALQQRIQNFQNRRNSAGQEIQTSMTRLESTQAHVNRQIGERLILVAEQVRAARNAQAVIAKNSLLANAPTIDVTAEILTQLNQQLPSVSVTPMPQQQQQPAPAQPQPQRPQGR
jgi:Skp family chaperone for outer membrane proteins